MLINVNTWDKACINLTLIYNQHNNSFKIRIIIGGKVGTLLDCIQASHDSKFFKLTSGGTGLKNLGRTLSFTIQCSLSLDLFVHSEL